MPFDFSYNDHTDYISKEGHYSMCKPHEATREEALLWHRVQELEKLLDEACPLETQAVMTLLATIPEGVTQIEMNATDFANIRQYARHRVEMVTYPESNRKGILGSLPLMVDGSPSSVWIAVNREVPQGSIRVLGVEPADNPLDEVDRDAAVAKFQERRAEARAEERRLSKYDR